MHDLSPLAILGIAIIVVIVIILNIGLVAFLRYRPTLNSKPTVSQNALRMNRFIEVVKDPFGEEKKQINELSRLVEKIQKPPTDDQSK